MSKIGNWRRFVSERLTSAAEEIFAVFEQTLIEYEKEIERQRIMLDIVWKPEVKLNRIDQRVCKVGEGLTDQQLSNQERISSLVQEEPEPPHIKEEQKEVFSSPEGEQFVPKQVEDAALSDVVYQTSPPSLMDGGDNKLEEDLQEPATTPPESISKPHTYKVHEESSSHKSQLVKPMESHKDKKTFSCSFCGKTFSPLSYLKIHIRSHTGEKPFSCSICKKSYSQRGHLTAHIRTHTGERPFSCSICKKAFSQRGHLTVHLRTHAGESFSCTICKKTFSVLPALIGHLRTHTVERRFSCSTCGKRFSEKRGLMWHMRTHTEDDSAHVMS